MIPSYPDVYALGHKAIEGLFSGCFSIEEKIDGSSFSFGILDGELCARSKGQQLVIDEPEKMFDKAIETIKELQPLLMPGYVYRSEYLRTPKHNAVVYGRVPKKHLIIFDVDTQPGAEQYLMPDDKRVEAERLGLECVPCFASLHRSPGETLSIDDLKPMLERESILGGSKVEGIVIKNYSLFTRDKKIACGKLVREDFVEVQRQEWKRQNPSGKDFTQELIQKYRTEARWRKAVQHLRERGLCEWSPRDIGPLLREIPEDVLKECRAEITDALFEHYWPQIKRGICAGVPEWYKAELATQAMSQVCPT